MENNVSNESDNSDNDDANVVAENAFYYKFDDEIRQHSSDEEEQRKNNFDGEPNFTELTDKQP